MSRSLNLVGIPATENGAVRPMGVTMADEERARLRDVLREDEARHLSLVKECSHAEFVAYSPPVGGKWDDHTNEPGYCITCNGWFIRTTWATRREPDYTAMRPEQIERIEERERMFDWLHDHNQGN